MSSFMMRVFFLRNEVADKVIEALADRDLPWICLTRADLIRGRIAELTDKCMDGAIVGIESYRDKNIADVRKRDDVYNVRATVKELIDNGRRALGTFMIGFGNDTIEDMEFDIKQARRRRPVCMSVNLAYPSTRHQALQAYGAVD